MINTTIRYIVYSHAGTGVRHHHFGTQNNIIDEADGHASTGDIVNALGFATLPFNGNNLPFAFMSVHGAADGNHLYTSPGNQQVQVGTADIDILVVYAPLGGIGGGNGGGPGVWVDAFNVDTGGFSDSLAFIEVLTPPTPPDTIDVAKTNFGNSDGGISTVAAENVRANSQVDGVPFVEWKKIVPAPTTQSSPDVHLTQNESGEIWFAFYQTPTAPTLNISKVIQLISAGIFLWTGDDTCGNGGHWVGPGHGPGPGPAPFKISVSKDIVAKMNPEQHKQLEAFTKEYPAVADSSLVGMTKALNIIQGVNKLLASTQKA
jgi:hypothetical protein